MGYRDWSAWLKGGIMGIIVCFLFFGLAIIFPDFGKIDGGIFIFIALFIMNTNIFECKFCLNCDLPLYCSAIPILAFVVQILVFFFIGAIIGWIVWKIKSRNEI